MRAVRRCLICGESKGRGSGRGNGRERRDKFLDFLEPCEECREEYLTDGVLLVEVAEEPAGPCSVPALTGRFMVVTDEAFRRVFTIPVPPHKIATAEFGLFEQILGPGDFN